MYNAMNDNYLRITNTPVFPSPKLPQDLRWTLMRSCQVLLCQWLTLEALEWVSLLHVPTKKVPEAKDLCSTPPSDNRAS